MRVTKLVVHHSASPLATTTRETIEGWHLQRGFRSIGYPKIIEGDGTIEDGRSERQMGAHAKGANANSLGVCVVGNFEQEEPTQGHQSRSSEDPAGAAMSGRFMSAPSIAWERR